MGRVTTAPDLRIDIHLRAEPSLPEDVLDGLTRPFKEIPPKHLYDTRGSELFDQICDLPGYYPTRIERAILDECADLIVRRTGAAELVELGSGTAAKTRVLLSAIERAGRCRPAARATCASTRSTSRSTSRAARLRTEISAKFTPARLKGDYEASGLELAEWFTDERGSFALSLPTRT